MSRKINNILITGANGFVGQHLTREMVNNRYTLFGVGGHDLPASISSFFEKYISLDLLDARSLEVLDFKNIDAVIHLAGLAAVGTSFDQPMKYIETNIGIELNLFEAALKQKAFPKFLIISSGSLYDPNNRLPLTEESRVLPNSPYALSKIGQEQLASYYSTRQFECMVARPFNHIGPGQGPGFIVPDLAEQITSARKNGAKYVRVGNLSVKRDYTDVRDIVRAYRLILESGFPGETYNVCSGLPVSGDDILLGLMKAAGCKLDSIVDKNKFRPNDTAEVYGSYSKLNNDTGWKPEINLEQTLNDVMSSM